MPHIPNYCNFAICLVVIVHVSHNDSNKSIMTLTRTFDLRVKVVEDDLEACNIHLL